MCVRVSKYGRYEEYFHVSLYQLIKLPWFQIWEKDGSKKGHYCHAKYPPTLQSTGNGFDIKYIYEQGYRVTGFVAYYESVGPIPSDITFMMAASRKGPYYAEAVAFLLSPLIDVPNGGHCLTFSYSMRSNLRVKVTSHKNTVMLANWVVDGDRAFHRAALALPHGKYKLIWEITDSREDFAEPATPYNRYLATVDNINIHNNRCFDIGKFILRKITAAHRHREIYSV